MRIEWKIEARPAAASGNEYPRERRELSFNMGTSVADIPGRD